VCLYLSWFVCVSFCSKFPLPFGEWHSRMVRSPSHHFSATKRLRLTLWLKLGVTVVRGGRGGVSVHHDVLGKKHAHFGETWTPKKIVIFWHKLPLRLASVPQKKLRPCAKFCRIPIRLPIPSKFSKKRMSDSPIPIPSGLKGTTIAGDQGSLDLYTMLEGFFRMGRNLRLWPWKNRWTFREILVQRKGRGHAGGGYYEKGWKRSGQNHIAWVNFICYNIMHCVSWSRTFAQESCIHACTIQVTAPALLVGYFEFWKSRVYLKNSISTDKIGRIQLAESNLQIRA